MSLPQGERPADPERPFLASDRDSDAAESGPTLRLAVVSVVRLHTVAGRPTAYLYTLLHAHVGWASTAEWSVLSGCS
jgi:hypothetical protein